MKNNTYYFTLKIHTPVHIGCDEVYEPTGFVVDEQKKELIAFEPEDFLGRLEPADVEAFSRICIKGTLPSLIEIYKFMRLKREHAEGWRIDLSDGFIEHYNNTLALRPNEVGQALNKFLISRTAFQAIDNVPYIPGSALKGALRTAVLNARNNGKTAPAVRRAGEMEEALLGGTFAKDPFRLVKISDFVALNAVRQKIVYAVNRKKKPSEKEARGPYQMMEVIEPDAEFFGSITIAEASKDSGVSKPLTLPELHQALEKFYGAELRRERDENKQMKCSIRTLNDMPQGAIPVRLGRHSGAECLTVEGRRDIKIMLGPGKSPKYLDHATTLWFTSPTSNPSSRTELQPFGWAGLTLLEEGVALRYNEQLRVNYNNWINSFKSSLVSFNERIQKLQRDREAAAQSAAILAEENRKKEEEQRLYPWRRLYPILTTIKDWGALKTRVLDHEEFLQHKNSGELGEKIADIATEIAIGNKKKWEQTREHEVKTWLKASGVEWKTGIFDSVVPRLPACPEQQAYLDRIAGCKGWGYYDQATLPTQNLGKEAAAALKAKFMQWGCAERKAKKQKQDAWKNLLAHIRTL